MPNEVTDGRPTTTSWSPSLGAWPEGNGFRLRVWAPRAKGVQIAFRRGDGWDPGALLQKNPDGYFTGLAENCVAGDRYAYFVDGRGPLPDPASRYQPEGVHGPSALVDSRTFLWTESFWKGVESRCLIFYELHIGTFTPEGTFQGTLSKLPYLRDLGITAIEIMPVADFPGNRNWGYDGVDLFAPARCYGTPDDLRRLVNDAHRLGLAVFLDVVYSHWGPEGNYTTGFSPFYLAERHQTPWGASVNLDGPESRPVRDFFIENALYWIHDFHFDGLRLDATHALVDESPRPFLSELTERVRESTSSRLVHVIAEDHRNLAQMIQSPDRGGWGLDGVWSDDFHHEIRRLLAGDHEGYYARYAGAVKELAAAVQEGWVFPADKLALPSRGMARERGAEALPYNRFVFCIQNHDQVGNRAFGSRLNQDVSGADYRAASALLLFCPETPLLFMGQEWAASSPFLYFSDHPAELGKRVTEGRRREFQHFPAFTDPAQRAQIPDPQDISTFKKSHLVWDELNRAPHQGILRLYQTLLRLRQSEPAWMNSDRTMIRVRALDERTLLVKRRGAKPAVALAVRFRCGGEARLPLSSRDWSLVFHTEEPAFARNGKAPRVERIRSALKLIFECPCAVMFRENEGVEP